MAGLLGVAVSLAFGAAGGLTAGWRAAPAGLLTVAALAAGWLEGRTAVKAAAAAAAAAAAIIHGLISGYPLAPVLAQVACLALFAGLAAGPRPPRAWLWMPALPAAAGPALAGLALATGGYYPALLATGLALVLAAVLAVAFLWLAVDARPAIGLLVTITLLRLGMLASLPGASVQYMLIVTVPWLLAAAVLAAPALWRLHRQSAPPARKAA
jgi:hypothetical protein